MRLGMITLGLVMGLSTSALAESRPYLVKIEGAPILLVVELTSRGTPQTTLDFAEFSLLSRSRPGVYRHADVTWENEKEVTLTLNRKTDFFEGVKIVFPTKGTLKSIGVFEESQEDCYARLQAALAASGKKGIKSFFTSSTGTAVGDSRHVQVVRLPEAKLPPEHCLFGAVISGHGKNFMIDP